MAMKHERSFLELNRDIIQGNAGGRVLWQPRIDCWYFDRIFSNGTLDGKYAGMSRLELYKELGCSSRVYEYNGCIVSYDDEPVTRRSEKISALETRVTYETPVGTVTKVDRSNTSNPGVYSAEWLAKNEDDVKVLIWLENNTRWKWNQEHWDKIKCEYGELGLPCIFVTRISIQKPIVETMGIESTIFGLCDYPETMEEYFDAIENNAMRMIDVICESPLEWINFGDNIHGGVISPALFEKYVLPAYLRRNEVLHKAGKWTFAHWDGDCKPLLKFARSCGLDGIEAITPVPQGDVTIDEIKEALGDEVFLVDGIPAILFDETYPVELLIETTKKLIEKFAPKLILGISDEMSSTGDIERVRIVKQMVDEYNAEIDRNE